MKGVLQGIPDIFWPENKNPFIEPRPAEGVPGDYYKEKVCVCGCWCVGGCVFVGGQTKTRELRQKTTSNLET